MHARMITFTLAHGRDTIPVPADPLESVVSRSLEAIGSQGGAVNGVKMHPAVEADLIIRNLIEQPFREQSVQFHNVEMRTFVGRRVTLVDDD